MTRAGLNLVGVSKKFGNHRALNSVSVQVEPGEFLSILGPSGCGKSTLLRIIAGLEDEDNGDVHIGGRSMRSVAPKDRGVAFVFQNYALYPHLSSYENIAAPLVMREMGALERLPFAKSLFSSAARKRKSIDERVRAISQLLQIEAFLDRRPAQLSGGQRQRIALGRALIREPDLFLLDEPFANLDAALRNHTRSELSSLQKRLGTTTIFVTHDQGEAMALSDRIVVMFGGEIRQVGTPDQLYRNPVDIEVARFLSQPHLNALPARIIVNGWALIAGEQIRIDAAVGSTPDGIVAVRPEHCSLSQKWKQGCLAGTVSRVEHAGADGHVFVTLDIINTDCVIRIPSDSLRNWHPGVKCFVHVDAASAWFFPGSASALPSYCASMEAA